MGGKRREEKTKQLRKNKKQRKFPRKSNHKKITII